MQRELRQGNNKNIVYEKKTILNVKKAKIRIYTDFSLPHTRT